MRMRFRVDEALFWPVFSQFRQENPVKRSTSIQLRLRFKVDEALFLASFGVETGKSRKPRAQEFFINQKCTNTLGNTNYWSKEFKMKR
jgi:hypothetical protein